MSALMNTFGNPLKCVKKRAAMGGLQVVQLDLIDATCWRNRVCPPGVPQPTDTKEIRKRAAKVEKLARQFPAVEFWVSPALEHDVKNKKDVVRMLEAAGAGCPSCKVINSPFTGARPDGHKLELHGTRVRAFSVSADGASSFDADNLSSDGNQFQHRNAGDYKTFFWWPELNLRCSGEDKFTAPKKRTEKPTSDQFKQAFALSQPEPGKPTEKPSSCQSVRQLEQGKEIYKPNAESYCNGQQPDNRGNKPLLIIKHSGKAGERLEVKDKAGRSVGCFKYWGRYPEMAGAHRWYMGNCSGQAPAKLMEDLGSEWGYVQLGAGECLLFNAVRRAGTYR